jgi:hypothetical protein
MAATPPRTFHNWSALSAELKLEVFTHHLSWRTGCEGYGADTIRDSEHAVFLAEDLGHIISTRNREIVELALEAYYKNNTFQAEILDKREHYPGNVSNVIMTYPPTAQGAHIRHLEIAARECVFAYALSDMLLSNQSAWRFLLEPKTALGSDPPLRNTLFRAHFPNLRTLKLYLIIKDMTSDPDFRECCIAFSQCGKLEGWLAETKFKIKTDKVEVLFRVWGGEDYYPDMCLCLKPLAEYIEEMATK